MQESFPTVAVFKEAAQLPFQAVGGMLASIGILFAAIFAGGIVLVIAFVVNQESMLAIFEVMARQGSSSAREMTEPIELAVLVTMVAVVLIVAVIMFFSAHIFNYWVNYATFGKEGAHWSFSEGRFSAAVVNALKLLLISILVMLINYVAITVASVLGLGPSTSNVQTTVDYAELTLSGLTGTIVTVVATSAIYSLFSANLTQTSLRSQTEGLEHPHTLDFAIVIILLYALILIPTVLAALTGSSTLTVVVSSVLTLYLMFTVPIAHGLRYRVCMAEKSEDDVV